MSLQPRLRYVAPMSRSSFELFHGRNNSFNPHALFLHPSTAFLPLPALSSAHKPNFAPVGFWGVASSFASWLFLFFILFLWVLISFFLFYLLLQLLFDFVIFLQYWYGPLQMVVPVFHFLLLVRLFWIRFTFNRWFFGYLTFWWDPVNVWSCRSLRKSIRCLRTDVRCILQVKRQNRILQMQ